MSDSQLSPRKKATQSRSKTTFESILQSTAQLLEAAGLKKLTTNKIAERAGVSIGSLYQYFSNKESVIVTLMKEKFNKHIAMMLEKIDKLDFQEKNLEEAIQLITPIIIDDVYREKKLTREMLTDFISFKALKFSLDNDEKMKAKILEKLQHFQDEVDFNNIEKKITMLIYAIKGMKAGYIFGNHQLEYQDLKDQIEMLLYRTLKR